MASIEIRSKFFDLLHKLFNTEVAEDFKNGILEDSFYRYAVDNEERINYLYRLTEGDIMPYHNPFTIKGVKYENGKFELIEREINELIKEYDVNLSNYNFGEFQNEMDKDKPFGLKSYRRLIMAVNDCLETQIINEMIRDLKYPNRNLDTSKNDIKPFRTIERFNQFETYIEKHINLHPTSENDIRNSYTELSFLFQMVKKKKFIEHTLHKVFTDWMYKNDFINAKLYKHVFEVGGLKSLDKSSTKYNVPIFNIVFELDL